MTDLAGLIERLEGATGKDPELDADLRWALDRQRAERAYWNGALGMPRALPEHAKLAGLGRISVISAFPSLTASLDAALAFVERVLPGWRVSIDSDQDRGPMWRAAVKPCGSHYTAKPTGWIYAMQATAPLAILIAALKALQEREGEGRATDML